MERFGHPAQEGHDQDCCGNFFVALHRAESRQLFGCVIRGKRILLFGRVEEPDGDIHEDQHNHGPDKAGRKPQGPSKLALDILGQQSPHHVTDKGRADKHGTRQYEAEIHGAEQPACPATLSWITHCIADPHTDRSHDGRLDRHAGNQRSDDGSGADHGQDLAVEGGRECSHDPQGDPPEQTAFRHGHSHAHRTEEKPPGRVGKRRKRRFEGNTLKQDP